MLAHEDSNEGLQITATPELAISSQAGAGLPLESSPKGLGEILPSCERQPISCLSHTHNYVMYL